MLRTPPIAKMASTHGGMRRILKKRLPVQKYIELAVKAGSYKSPSTRPNYLGLHDVPEPKGYMSPREREERLKLQRGIIDYPTEYEILSLNPPLPNPPKTPVRVRKKILAEKRRQLDKLKRDRKKKGLPTNTSDINAVPTMDTLVKSYLRRHEEKVRSGMSPSQAKQEEEYYSKLLLGQQSGGDEVEDVLTSSKKRFLSPSSLQTAMGRKSMVVENAYAFALRQQQVMLNGDEEMNAKGEIMSEQESVERVEQLLKDESRANRQKGQQTAKDVKEWRASQDAKDGDNKEEDDSTLPSILHERPRAIRALNIWSSRLSSIPYSRWTIGASTALDHWIAREVLQMDEQVWQQVLEGGGTDAYVEGIDTLLGGESKRGLNDRMRDIIMVRGALFPETLTESSAVGGGGRGLTGDLDDGLLSAPESNATEKSIDDLLASLGDFGEDDDQSWKFDDEEDKKDEEEDAAADDARDEQVAIIMDELQVWRGRNESSQYDSWDTDRKGEFDEWIEKYVSIIYPEADASSVDKEATRISLLSERPVDTEKTKEFWSNSGTETDAELFLKDYRSSAEAKLNTLWSEAATLTDEQKETQLELETILSVPFDIQLDKLVNMGTLRPILDEYAPGKERKSFLEKYAPIFLEGLEMEHLVPDPDGAIGIEDLSGSLRDEFSKEWTPEAGGQEPRFSIRMVAYGTDEYGTSRAERSRELYRLWNEHKANRAKFEEKLFKKGMYVGIEEDGTLPNYIKNQRERIQKRLEKQTEGKTKND